MPFAHVESDTVVAGHSAILRFTGEMDNIRKATGNVRPGLVAQLSGGASQGRANTGQGHTPWRLRLRVNRCLLSSLSGHSAPHRHMEIALIMLPNIRQALIKDVTIHAIMDTSPPAAPCSTL